MVFDVACSFLQVKGFEVETDGDALVEGFVRSETELVSQVGLCEEDEGQRRSGIHVVVEQKAELVQEFGGEEMGFVDDEEDVAAPAGQVGERSVELREEPEEAEGVLGLKLEKDLAAYQPHTAIEGVNNAL